MGLFRLKFTLCCLGVQLCVEVCLRDPHTQLHDEGNEGDALIGGNRIKDNQRVWTNYIAVNHAEIIT